MEAEAEAPAAAAVDPSSVPLWLPRFYTALSELERGVRARHVRVLWFGDSHTAADFWTHRVRQTLQTRFGAGGAGVVVVGLKYRHGLAQASRVGKWQMLPRSPAATWAQGDGIFGLAGVGAVPLSADAAIKLELGARSEWTAEPLRWEVLYREGPTSSGFRLQSGDEPPRRIDGTRGEPRASGLRAVVVETRGARTLVVDEFVGAPQLYGVIVESDKPGLVLDTLGINGARAATPLAWSLEPWLHEVRARAPDLIVLSYGTNEVGDAAPVSTYRDHYRELLGRLRLAAPGADCLLIGPTDRVRKDWTSDPRVTSIDAVQREAARELGCAFFSALGTMGGPGSLRRWAFATPQLARRDRVHLLPVGYGRLGDELARQLLESYAALHPSSQAFR